MRQIFLVLTLIPVLFSGTLKASSLEDTLEYRLRGSWALTKVEVLSDCGGIYNNNEVHAAGVSSKASHRFEAGELVHIDKINLKSSRIDLFLRISEPILSSRMDGPFRLFDERSCKVQLIIPLSRSLTHGRDPVPVLAEISKAIEVFSSRQDAVDADGWNHRIREDYPPDYEETLYEHSVWKTEETNAAISARIEQASRDALRVIDRISKIPAYLSGFAAGVASMRHWSENDCEDLLSVRFESLCDRPDRDGREYRDGFRDGQELSFNLLLADRLQGCFLPPPPRPE